MDKITVDQVRSLAAEIVAESPDVVNPRNALGMCVYNKASVGKITRAVKWIKRIKTADRCLGGEILHRLGLAMPLEGLAIERTSDRDMLTRDALEYLVKVQYSADGMRSWDFALSNVARVYETSYSKDQE